MIDPKKIIIISTYPSTEYAEEILMSCINSVSNKGYDIMVVSHYPLPVYIQEKINYYIYDKENTKLPFELTPISEIYTDLFSTSFKDNGHSLTICKNMFNSISLANALNYDFFFYTESDNEFNEEDFIKLDNLCYQVIKENKQMVFFENIYNEIIYSYDTLLFGGVPSFFIQNIKLPTTVEEYRNINEVVSLERLFPYITNHLKDNFLIINKTLQEFFYLSKFNKIACNYFADIAVDNNNNFILFFYNFNEPTPINFTINKTETISLNLNNWFFCFKNIGDEIEVEINNKGQITHKHFVLTEDNKSYYKNKNLLTFKNHE
jgi:hypothetical protein